MIRDNYNIVPVFLAALLHTLVLLGMVFAYDFSAPAHPVIPLAINATLVTDSASARPSKSPPVERKPEPEPAPQVDPAIEQRREAEEQKRQEDLRVEQERIRREKTEEEKRKQQAEAERKKRDEAERKKRDEAERDRREKEAEKKRQENVERQRLENERLRKEAEAAAMQQRRDTELAAEQDRLDAMASKQQHYAFLVRNHIYRFWAPPASAMSGIECDVSVRQAPGGVVVGFTINSCTGDEAVRRSVEAAIQAASPLPLPPDPSVFDRNLRLILKTEQ